MTSRRAFLIAGTGTLAASVAACGGGVRGATPVLAQPQSAGPQPIPTSSPVSATSFPVPAQASPARPPSTATGGSIRQLGTQTLAEFLTSVRAGLPEGLDAANTRLLPVSGVLAFCGATIWRDKYSVGIAGGHGDSFDDGHYAQNLSTGLWETLALPSEVAAHATSVDAFGEWVGGTPGRPASQHSYCHLVTVGDNIVQGYGYAIGSLAQGSKQAHRWNGRFGAWERYGTFSGTAYSVSHAVFHDGNRNLVVRIPILAGTVASTIPANDPTAAWTPIPIGSWPASDIYASIGFHPDLDCYVLVDQHEPSTPNRVWVMDAGNIAGGWVEVTLIGSAPTPMISGGLAYVPPMRAFASVNYLEADKLYYLTPTGATRLGSWTWTSETFKGATTPAAWIGGGVPNAPQGRVQWSSLLNALVMVKDSGQPTELFTPSTR